MADRPETEARAAAYRAVQRATVDARPRGVHVTGDVENALMPVVLADLASVLPTLDPQEFGTLRWLCGWEVDTVARVVSMIRRAADRCGSEAQS